MNIQWVLSDELMLAPTFDINQMKKAGSFWGSWKTWRAYNTDNVICHDAKKAEELIKRSFQTTCNFYIPNSIFTLLNRPKGVKIYEGDFMGHEIDNQDELVAMNLAGSIADVVLLIGFDFSDKEVDSDKLREHKHRNHQGIAVQAIKSRPAIQWILVDHEQPVSEEFAELPNLDKDSYQNVLSILGI